MLIYQKRGWEVWPLQIEVVHMYACRSKSGCARYVRATKKRVATHTLIVSSKCFSETDVMRDTPGSFLWETVLKVICIYICDSFHLYLIGLTPFLGDRRGFMPPQLKHTCMVLFSVINSLSFINKLAIISNLIPVLNYLKSKYSKRHPFKACQRL